MESQHSEFKTTWRDEYLKWICGFANANGGSIIIGMDDDGTIVGVEDYKRLLEDIPNKARNTMGITVSILLL
jgi:ATP-dependent DNA helicase RecG